MTKKKLGDGAWQTLARARARVEKAVLSMLNRLEENSSAPLTRDRSILIIDASIAVTRLKNARCISFTTDRKRGESFRKDYVGTRRVLGEFLRHSRLDMTQCRNYDPIAKRFDS